MPGNSESQPLPRSCVHVGAYFWHPARQGTTRSWASFPAYAEPQCQPEERTYSLLRSFMGNAQPWTCIQPYTCAWLFSFPGICRQSSKLPGTSFSNFSQVLNSLLCCNCCYCLRQLGCYTITTDCFGQMLPGKRLFIVDEIRIWSSKEKPVDCLLHMNTCDTGQIMTVIWTWRFIGVLTLFASSSCPLGCWFFIEIVRPSFSRLPW